MPAMCIKNLKWKPATLLAVLLWVLIFAEMSILMFIPILKDNSLMQRILHLIILPFLVLLCAYMYFKDKKADMKDGLVLGVWFLIIGTVLDLAITIPLFVKSFSFYKALSLWIGFLEVLVFASIAGWLFGKKK